MWKCPKCNREFKSVNQDHYCGDSPTNIDEYISFQNEDIQPILNKIRAVIKSVAPDSKEKISWRMPTFYQTENLIHFAAFKNHIGIYPGALDSLPFKEQLKDYHTSKGAIQFSIDKIDYDLIAEITKYRVSMVTKK